MADTTTGLEGLTEKERHHVIGLCYRLTQNWDAAEELAHRAVLKALRYRFNGGCKRTTWLFMIARHIFFNDLRGKKPVFVLIDDALRLEHPGMNSLAKLLAEEEKERLREAVKRLPWVNQETIITRVYQDQSVADAAKNLNITVNALKARQFRGTIQLRKMLKAK